MKEAGQVRYWQYGQAENSPDLVVRFTNNVVVSADF